MPVTRFEATPGATVRLRVRFTRNGSPFDPDAINRVEIHKRTGPTDTLLVATIDGSAVVQETQGIYYVDWGIPSDIEVGAYLDRWYFVRDLGDVEEFDDGTLPIFEPGAFAGTGYISVDEVRDGYLIDSPLTDAQIQVLIDEATEIVYYGTGRNFAGEVETIMVDGTGAPWLIMPTPALDVDSITAGSCGGDVRELDPDEFVIKGRWLVSKCFRPTHWDLDNPVCDVCSCSPCGGVFPYGHRNIAVTGRFGLYQNVPALIKRASGLWCKYAGADGTISAPAASNYDSESVEQHSYGRRPSDHLGSVKLRGHTGIYEIDHILNTFRATTIRMAVI